MLQHVGDAPDDGETQTEAPAAVPFRIADLIELLENLVLLRLRDAGAGIGDDDPDTVAASSAPQQDAARRGVGDGVGKQVAEDAVQQFGVGGDRGAARHRPERQAFQFRLGSEFGVKPLKQRSKLERFQGRFDQGRVQP